MRQDPSVCFFCRQVFFGKHNFKTKSANFFHNGQFGAPFFHGLIWSQVESPKGKQYQLKLPKKYRHGPTLSELQTRTQNGGSANQSCKKNSRLLNCRPGPRREAAPTKAEQIQAPTISELQTWKGGSTNSRLPKIGTSDFRTAGPDPRGR